MADIENRFPTIAANWEHFEKVDIAPTAPQVQRTEMKRAFMAGASSSLALMCFTLNEHNVDRAAWEEIAKLNAELMTYRAMRKAGRA